MEEAKNPVRAVETDISIIEALHDLEEATLAEISNRVGMTKGTVHNHLSTLEEHRFVIRNDNRFRLGIRFFEFGEEIRRKKGIYEVGKPEVEKLAEETGELANILIEEHGYGIYLYRAKGENALTLDTGIGARVHLHNTALGKAILSQLPQNRVENILNNRDLLQTTGNTITDRDELFDELQTIQERNYALDLEERANGIRCIAAPVVTKDEVVHGAISVAGPTGRMKDERLNEELPERIQNVADVISINLTYS